jgi:hypothetical protein
VIWSRLAGLVLGLVLVALAVTVFSNRDQASVRAAATGPGQAFPDQGHAVLAPGTTPPAYNSTPPTSGPHAVVAVTRDDHRLSTGQLLTALQSGDIVIQYGHSTQRRPLRALQRGLSGPFRAALAAAGQAVLLEPVPGTPGVIALAWAHMQRSASPADPALLDFARYWLGQGAPR